MNDAKKVAIIIPAFNEAAAIGDALDSLLSMAREHNWQVVVIDDGSADDTAKIVAALPVYLLVHPINLGQGAALATGIDYALSRGADYVVTFDSDGQMCPEDIPRLLEQASKPDVDVALGSRFLTLKPQGMPFIKKIVLKMAVIFTRITTGLKVSDVHNGFRVFKAQALAKISIRQNRMAHASEILSEIARSKLKYKEVPVTIRYTEYSKAKGQSISNAFNILFGA